MKQNTTETSWLNPAMKQRTKSEQSPQTGQIMPDKRSLAAQIRHKRDAIQRIENSAYLTVARLEAEIAELKKAMKHGKDENPPANG